MKITVYDESNAKLADEEQDFTGRAGRDAADRHLEPVERCARSRRSSCAPTTRRDNWVGVELAPWFVNIPHDDVNFKTDSAEIDAAEVPKVEAAYGKIAEALAKDAASGRMHAGITLYIAGHTDTVGNPTHNFKLSQDRARSIAALVPQARRQDPDLLRRLRRDVAGGQDRRQHRRGQEPPRRLHPLRRPPDALRRLPAVLETNPVETSRQHVASARRLGPPSAEAPLPNPLPASRGEGTGRYSA